MYYDSMTSPDVNKVRRSSLHIMKIREQKGVNAHRSFYPVVWRYDDTFIESSSIYLIINESEIIDKYRTGINTLVGPSIH